MSGKPKTIPSLSHDRKTISDSGQMPMPYDQNRSQKCTQSDAITSDAPTDENFVNDDIIEENSHVIPPSRKPASQGNRQEQKAQ